MKKTIIFSLLFLLATACREKEAEGTEISFPTYTIDGNKYLDLEKSSYYPHTIKSLEELDRPYGVIAIDSTDGAMVVKAAFWMADSAFRHMAQIEKLLYKKTFFLDTTYKENIFDWKNGFKVNSTNNDTAYFQINANHLNLTPEELKKRWSLKINCHFEDKNGIDYDTIFVATFNEDWMQ